MMIYCKIKKMHLFKSFSIKGCYKPIKKQRLKSTINKNQQSLSNLF